MYKKMIVLWLLCFNLAVFAANYESIDSLLSDIKHGKSCQVIIQAYTDRIKQFDLDTSRGAPLNAVVWLNPQAMVYAKQLDAQFNKTKQLSGPLHCVPVVIKDNFNTFDMPTSVGSLAMLGNQSASDSDIVKQLRKSGAIILAKTGMDEFASGLSGLSSRSGRIGNAFNPKANSGGSSGGSAVAVASGFALVGMGTDNSGSIRIPAVFNDLFGLRPGSDYLSKRGIFPRGNIDGVPGPMTRNLDDMRLVLQVISKEPPSAMPIYKRIGLIYQINDHSFDFKRYKQLLSKLSALNYQLIPIHLSGFNNDRTNNAAGEVEEINQYLNTFPAVRRNFLDICTSKRTHSFGTLKECEDYAKSSPKVNSKIYKATKKMIIDNHDLVSTVMKEKQLDALLMPLSVTGVATYQIDNIHTGRYPLSSNTGLPSLAMPIGYNSHGMPIGLEVIGPDNSEVILIQLAKQWQTLLPKRNFPHLRKSNHDLRMMDNMSFNNLKARIGWASFNQFMQTSNDTLPSKYFTKLVDRIIAAFDTSFQIGID